MSETQNQMVITQTCVDLQFTGQKPPVLQCMQYDTNLRLLEIRLQKDGADWPVPEGWAVNLRMKKSDGTSIYQAATYEGCLVYLILTGQMCCVAGEHSFVLEITGEDQVIQTPVLLLKVWKNPISSREFTSQSDYQILRDMVEEVQQSVEAAQSSAQSAAESASSLSQSATAAANHAAAAAASAAAAQEDAGESQTNADQAYNWNQNCITLYHAVEELHTQIAQQLQQIQSVDVNQNMQVLSQAQYDALTPPNPKRLYLAESSHPNNHLVSCFPLQEDWKDQLNPTFAATPVGGQGLGSWDDTGKSCRTLPAAGAAMTLGSLVNLTSTQSIQLYDNGYILLPRTEGSSAYVAVSLRSPSPFQAGVNYTFAMTSQIPTSQNATPCYGNAGHLALAKTDGTILDLGTAISSSSSGSSGSIAFTAPEDIAEYTQIYFYYDNPAYNQYITLSITCTASPTIRQNYLTLPAGLFAGKDFSGGISFALDIKPDNLADWTRIFQFYAPAAQETGEGDLYATQGVTATGFWESLTVQQMGLGNYQCVTPGVWHTFVFTVSPTQLCIYLDGALKTAANDTGSTLSGLLSHLDCFTQNYLGYSRFEDNDYAGLLKNFRIYDKALSPSEAAQVGTAPSARLYWGSLLLADSQEET